MLARSLLLLALCGLAAASSSSGSSQSERSRLLAHLPPAAVARPALRLSSRAALAR